MADDVVVMYLGRVVEQGNVDDIFHDPKHPYTKALLAIDSEHRLGAAREAADDQRLDPASVQPPEGLSVPSALRVVHGRPLRRRGAAAQARRQWAAGELLPLRVTLWKPP
jgi:ABC-type dipeptide/oligopeptide/nickel transport system ATPase component